MREAIDAWVAKPGQRRSVEGAVPKGSAGSNPVPRTVLQGAARTVALDISPAYTGYGQVLDRTGWWWHHRICV